MTAMQQLEGRNDEQCSRQCDACSQCTRAAAVKSNLRKYGQPDYPGIGGMTMLPRKDTAK